MKQLDPKAVWLFFIRYILRCFIFLGIISVYLAVFLYKRYISISELLVWLWIIIPALLVIFYIWARLSYRFYRYDLNDNGFRKESGVIWKKYVTIPYGRIQNVDIFRGIWARILGLSDLNIQTAGLSSGGGRYGTSYIAEGRLPGLSQEEAEKLRDELIQRARKSKNQGL